MSLLKAKPIYKPFQYPWAYEAWHTQQKIHWLPEEVDLAEDIKDWIGNLTPSEKNLLTQIFRFFTQADIEVNNCYMKHYSSTFQPTEVKMMLCAFSNIECFDNQTELLTNKGWKNVKDIKDSDIVANYNKETEEIAFSNPLKVVKYRYQGVLHHYHNKVTDLMVTPNHDLILKNPHTHNVTKRKSYQGKWGRNFLYPVAGKVSEADEELSIIDRICIMIQADGNIRALCPSVKNKDYRLITIKVKKERKKERIEFLLHEAGIEYHKGQLPDDMTTFSFTLPDEYPDCYDIKNLNWINLDNYTAKQAQLMIEEALLWDGSADRYYYNTNEDAVDKLQAVAVLAGIACTKGVNYEVRENIQILNNKKETKQTKTCYVLSFSQRVWRTYPHRKEVQYDDYVYCVSIANQNLVSRRNGKVIITGNTIHIASYSYLLDTIGMPETEYAAFMDYKEMKDKYDYMQTFHANDKVNIAKTLAVFGAFTEGLQLFASFSMLLNFPRHNLMKGMGQIVTWSVRDETLHCNSIIKLFKVFIEENPEVWTKQLQQEIYDACNTTIKHEDAFIDLAFGMGDIQGMTPDDIKNYIRYIGNHRLIQLGLKPLYSNMTNPLPWLVEILNGVEHTNFFENRVTEYSKASIQGDWSEVFANYFK